MSKLLLGAIAGTMFGIAISAGVSVYSQQPEWYQNTLQGQWQRQRDILDLQFQQDLQRLEQSYPHPYSKPPC